MIRFIEMSVCKKPTSLLSEDLIGYNNGFYWLIDGATPPVGDINKELTQLYINLLNVGLVEATMKSNSSEDALYSAIDFVRNEFDKRNVLLQTKYLPHSTAIILKLSRYEIEYSVLGDSTLFIFKHDTKEQWTIIDNRIHDVAVKERNKVREMRSKGIDENSALYLDARKELIFKELEKQNVENGFWIACTNPVAARKAITGKISLTNNTTVFAMSDGLARLITHFDVYRGFTDVINEIKTNGAQKVFELLRELESKKENFKKPISSTHDDASFLLIDIEPNKD